MIGCVMTNSRKLIIRFDGGALLVYDKDPTLNVGDLVEVKSGKPLKIGDVKNDDFEEIEIDELEKEEILDSMAEEFDSEDVNWDDELNEIEE